MALSAGTVSLAVKADTAGLGARLASQIRGEGSAISGIGKHLGGLLVAGLGAAGVAVGVGEILKTGFDEYKIADSLNAQFAAGIKSTGNAARLSVKGMDELAASIAGYSGQSYASIGKTEQVLQTFVNLRNVGPNKIFDQATEAAANMSAKLGGDASESAIRLGKALNDPVKGMTALKRVGVMFTEDQKKSIETMVKHGDIMGAQKIILKELSTEFGGAAKAAGETLPGSLNRGKVAFGELSKAIVESVGPTVTNLVVGLVDKIKAFMPQAKIAGEAIKRFLTDTFTAMKPALTQVWDAFKSLGSWIVGTGVPAVQNFARWLRENWVWLAPIAVGVGAMVLAFKAYEAVMGIVKTATAAYAVVQGVLNAVMAANPIGLVVLAIVGLAAGLTYAYKSSQTFRDLVSDAFHVVKLAGLYMAEGVIGYMKLLVGFWLGVVGAIVNGAATAFGWLPGIGPKVSAAAEAFNGMKDRINGSLDKIQKDIKLKIDTEGATRAVDMLERYYHDRNWTVTATANVNMVYAGHGQAVPARAAGGPVTAGHPYIVGDGGRPELFVPSVDGTIIPKVPTGMGGGHSGATSADIKALGVELVAGFGAKLDAQARMIETMRRQMAGAR